MDFRTDGDICMLRRHISLDSRGLHACDHHAVLLNFNYFAISETLFSAAVDC